MFDRIHVNVIQVHPRIPGIADRVLPKPALPNAAKGVSDLAGRNGAASVKKKAFWRATSSSPYRFAGAELQARAQSNHEK